MQGSIVGLTKKKMGSLGAGCHVLLGPNNKRVPLSPPPPPPQIIKDVQCDLDEINENIIIRNIIKQRTLLDLASKEKEHDCFQECLLGTQT